MSISQVYLQDLKNQILDLRKELLEFYMKVEKLNKKLQKMEGDEDAVVEEEERDEGRITF